MSKENLKRSFTNLMLTGKLNAALRLITEQGKGGVLPLNLEVIDSLQKKHPPPEPLNTASTLQGTPPLVNPIIFAGVTGETIRNCALHTQGAAGPSGGDAEE